MNVHSLPVRQRFKMALRRGFNTGADTLRKPFRRAEILVATGDASPEKVGQIEERLRFLGSHLDADFPIKRIDNASFRDCFRSAGVAAVNPQAISPFVRRYMKFKWVVDLDFETNPFDAWRLIDLGTAITNLPTAETVASARQTFTNRVELIRSSGPKPVYLFGTGPSLRLARDRSFADGTTVVCNTIVRDRELWHHLDPEFLTAGDAIYHFGHTSHAQAFRADALQRLRESKGRTLFVYPAQFDIIVRPEFRDVEQLLIPVPMGGHTDPTADLTLRFEIPPLDNVLSAMLLPLGCTLSTDVRLWGFDGRAPSDKGFWSNSSTQSYPELMQALREAHPAFYEHNVPKGNEIQYVAKVHGDLLDQRLTEAEIRGFQFRMLHPSWTPTFQKRYADVHPGRDYRQAT